MSKKTLEEISALMDGELADGEAQHLTELPVGRDERHAWRSYHLARDVMQKDYCSALPANFADRVSALVAAEQKQQNANQSSARVVAIDAARKKHEVRMRRLPQMLLPAVGLAVAASLVAVTFFSVKLSGPATDPLLNNVQALATTTGNESGFKLGTRWLVDDNRAGTSTEQRLNSMLTNHLEVATMGKVHGMMLHSRVVGYDTGSATNVSF